MNARKSPVELVPEYPILAIPEKPLFLKYLFQYTS
jgi:hypothetical protein